MPYNLQKHNRQSIRLQHYDYSQPGSYFVTSCCQHMICRFGKIVGDELAHNQNTIVRVDATTPKMVLNELGLIAYNEWMKLPERFPNVELGVFQIMPNHMHGIITLLEGDNLLGASGAGASRAGASRAGASRAGASPAPTVGNIVGSYKSLVSNACLEIFKANDENMGKLWQRDFYEHIVRDGKAYDNISNYIINNPSSWNDDKFYNE